MKQIFEAVPTADSIRKWINEQTQTAMKHFATRVAQAMWNLSENSFTMQSSHEFNALFHGIHKQKIIDALDQKWWNIQLISDQRDWDYFRISMKSWSAWQPMQD